MGRRKRVKTRTGDVFAIPIDETRFCYGQIVDSSPFEWYVVYDIVRTEHPPVVEVTQYPIVFMVCTTNVLFENGTWTLLGNTTVPSNIRFPVFKSLHSGEVDEYFLTNHQGDIIRYAMEDEIKLFSNHTSWSPAALDRAVKWKFGNGDKLDIFDRLLYKP